MNLQAGSDSEKLKGAEKKDCISSGKVSTVTPVTTQLQACSPDRTDKFKTGNGFQNDYPVLLG